jgi:ABC-type nitrate/sulfonate/bicarbonate transport system permease component
VPRSSGGFRDRLYDTSLRIAAERAVEARRRAPIYTRQRPTLLPGPTEVVRVFMALLFEPFAGSTLPKHLVSSLLRFL